MQAIDDDSLMVEQREKEIMQIVRSIQDLNDIFKELSFMIVDQVQFYCSSRFYFLLQEAFSDVEFIPPWCLMRLFNHGKLIRLSVVDILCLYRAVPVFIIKKLL